MTIREKSQLSFISYAYKLVLPDTVKALYEGFKESIVFFWYLIVLIFIIPFILIATHVRRSADKRFVERVSKK